MAGKREFDEKKNLLYNIRSHTIRAVGLLPAYSFIHRGGGLRIKVYIKVYKAVKYEYNIFYNEKVK